MLNLIRLLLGYVIFFVKGPFPERFINLCAHHGICIWNIKKYKNYMICSAMASEYDTLKTIANRSSMKINIQEKKGLPFVLKKYKKRKGILAGILIFYITIYFMSLYIWNIDINGNSQISKAELLETLNELNIHTGIFKNKIDLSNIESTLMSKYNNIAWTSANICGCNLELEIKEKISPPEILTKETPCNIKAACDAFITRLEIYSGTPEVKPGDSVIKNQLLVNGIFEDNFGQNRIHHASAKIFAITNKILSSEIDLNPKERIYTGKKINRKKLNFFNFEIPTTLKPKPRGTFEKNVNINKLNLFGRNLPITIYKETWSEYYEQEKIISTEKAIEIANKNIQEQKSSSFENIKILKEEKKEKISNGKYILTINYTCEENIAVESPLHSE